jgi:hypothetical protein
LDENKALNQWGLPSRLSKHLNQHKEGLLMPEAGGKAAYRKRHHETETRNPISPSCPLQPLKQLQPSCPECGSAKAFRNGTMKSRFGVRIQRYICRSCGRRFSCPDDLEKAKTVADSYMPSESLNLNRNINQSVQVCALMDKKEAKNLHLETTEKISVSQKEKLNENGIDLVLVDYEQYIRKEHLVNDLTLSKYIPRLKWLHKQIGVDLFDPEDFKRKLAFDPILSAKTNCNKNSICKAYSSFVKKYLHIENVKIPYFEYKTPEYNVPQTRHMELLYAALSFQMQVLFRADGNRCQTH